MHERWFRIGAAVEWLVAAGGVLLVLWVVSGPMQRLVGRGVQAAIAEGDRAPSRPPGVPADALLIPVMLLLDGQELRLGDLQSRLDAVLPGRFADGPPVVSTTELGERHTRVYKVNGTRVFVVCERSEPSAPMKVAGIYLP